jgi:Zn-finger nucleic acid-binding protein
MTCANCGASTRLDRDRGVFICEYCGGEYIPPAGEDGVQVLVATELRCAACEGTLSEGQIESHALLYCELCRGVLISMEWFIPLIELLRSYRDRPAMAFPPRAAENGRRPRICPHCSQPMENHPYMGPGNVVIDTCESCSVNWLDRGELQRIVAAPDPSCYVPLYSKYGGAAGDSERSRDDA